MQKKSILFVYVNFSSFVKTDYEILASFANVTKYQFKPGKGIARTGYRLFGQFLYLLINVWRYDSVFIWFSDFHSLIPVLFAKITGKRSYVVIGGYEVARIKSLNYGALCSKIRGFFCIATIKLATMNFTVSGYVDRKVKFIVPRSNRKMIYNCVDIQLISVLLTERDKLILTVGLVENERTFYLKGIDTFIELANHLPHYQFLIIGVDEKKLLRQLHSVPENLTILGRVPHDQLESYYLRSEYYCQLSRSESFGVSVAEAMYYGCIPVVTNEGGLPEVVGEKGYIVKRDPFYISNLISGITQINSDFREEISRRTIDLFNREKRAEKIRTAILNG